MSELLGLARRLAAPTAEERGDLLENLQQEFVEELTFSSAEDIVNMLRTMLQQDWMGLPPWARNLAFRLACLQRPDDAELLRVAAADLIAFGPDWNDVARGLQAEADRIEAASGD
ncbi:MULTISPECIES: hypothetical protein [Micromonospora]|uniref:hypothetical protein n=1 Tax=Micromonospora TaxID=1873 RepID=UPI001B37E1C0|nr:hypothetical protein [Micromonospora sp. U21]MBQ0900957.1 hypothetical protein [Micromonospora sp. U21]